MGTGLMVLLVLLILAGLIGGGIALSIYLAKRAGKGGGPLAAVMLPGQKPPATKEGGELIAADDALREANQELDFASASLGDEQVAAARAALDEAGAKLTQAFDIKKQLDSATVDPGAKAGLTEQIYLLANQVQQAVTDQLAAIKGLSGTAEALTQSAGQLGASLDAIDQRAEAARPAAAAMAGEYSEKVAADAGAKLDQATELTALARKSLAIAAAKAQADQLAEAAEPLKAAQQAAQRADALVAGVEKLPEDLVAAQLALSSTLEQANTEVKTITDGSHATDGPAATALASLNALIAQLPASGKSSDPLGDLEKVRAAQAGLGRATGSVGKATMSPAQARSALSGTLMAARQHLSVVDDAIAVRPGSVGADARVKAGQARQLIQQAKDLAASDPVQAIDLAWQADQAAAAAEKSL